MAEFQHSANISTKHPRPEGYTPRALEFSIVTSDMPTPRSLLLQARISPNPSRCDREVQRHVLLSRSLDIGFISGSGPVSGCYRQSDKSKPILRTRIADSTRHGLVQVVLRNAEPVERSFNDLAAYLEVDRAQPMGLGTPLARWALVNCTLALTIHQAAYDLTSIKAMKEDCLRVFHGQEPTPRPPFGLFAERCMNVDESAGEAFWRPRFSKLAAIFPDLDP
ncbi:hypothetical protein EJ03DRAFT_386361 [Teratosphaeria nubilosa]|uniref:Uncharacterized protein n=1 Tax=Teratosphaeria nubilosa TaxID=161662 RepID=A0A6G1KU88_9PEZI|nr:hypothetical protein EJ03DRAFT_386361 [Teratosphaeria nubilosa]